MMWKAFGAMLIFVGCSVGGLSYGGSYGRRVDQLRQFISAMQMMQAEIGFAATPLLEMLPRLKELTVAPVSLVFEHTQRRLSNGSGYTAAEAWEEALNAVIPRLDLSRSDYEILLRFGRGMASGGKEEQLKGLQLAQQQLGCQEREAAEERLKYERLYKTMGLLVGLALVVVFI